MIAGASWAWWAGFHAVAAALLVADSWFARRLRVHSRSAGTAQMTAWLATAVMVAAAVAFAIWIALAQGRQPALEFAAGYTVELSLSVDNLFVFMVLFQSFQLGEESQRKALLWGVGGAAILRALFIAAGIALLSHFRWVPWVMGAFLLYVAWRLVRGHSAKAVVPGWLRRMQPARGSLLPVIVAVELTDLLFATDSIPAVLAVTHNPFVAYTSNIAAILGLRSLYFALASLLDRFRLLHYGLGAILAFVGIKMLASQWFEVPVTVSLIVMAAILAVSALASVAMQSNEEG